MVEVYFSEMDSISISYFENMEIIELNDKQCFYDRNITTIIF